MLIYTKFQPIAVVTIAPYGVDALPDAHLTPVAEVESAVKT